MARGEEVVERMAEKHGAQGRCRVFKETCDIMRCRCTIGFIHLGGQWYLIYGSSKRRRCPTRSPQRLETLKADRRWEKNEANKVSSYSQGSRGMG